jgi:hypothetical protein
LTVGNCLTALEALRADVKRTRANCSRYFDHRQVSRSMDLEGQLSLLENELGSLRYYCGEYFSPQG